ncbi:hypothetical protein DPMN_187701 [Dreissena polymorpha]|uniref:Uncharacterized protein n=1 Tax=Dreissena polymorpha TaxID=45954 RepID=A0A9D4I7S8_DREPO|nr:hypothetical protein DPMN_187701 [Dreissena polymorpha]
MKSAKALPRYGSGHKSDGQTGSRTDSRTTPNNIPPPLAGDIYSYQVSRKSAKALPRYGSGHKSAYSKKHFFKIQRAITLFLTDGIQCHLACIIL